MKRTAVLLSIIVSGTIQVFSQNHYYSIDNYEFDFYDDVTKDLMKQANPNETISITESNKKGKLFSVTTYKLNENQKMISTVVTGKSGKEKSKKLINYKGKHIVSKSFYKNNQLKIKTENTFDGDYKIAYTKLSDKGRILYKRTIEYTDKEFKILAHKTSDVPFLFRKKTKATIAYKKGGTQQNSRWSYEYDENGVRTKSTLYNKKNKVKHVWDYTCKSEGEIVQLKNETQQCQWEESENGMLVKVTRTTSSNGKIQKSIQKYNSDTNIVESATYVDDVLINKGTYAGDYAKTLTWEYYLKGKLKHKKEYTYNEDEKKIGYKSYWGKDKSMPKREVKYSYDRDRLVAINTFRKGEAIESSKITYN